MKNALVLCPAWSIEMPHLAMAMLSSVLRRDGHQVFNFDLNNHFFHHCQDKYKRYWSKEYDLSWTVPDFISEFISQNEKLIDAAIDEILATKAKIIGFSVYFPTELMSLALARRLKEKDKSRIIIFGGTQCLRHYKGMVFIEESCIDIVATGEGDLTLSDIVKIAEETGNVDFCKGTLIKRNGKIIDCGDREPIMDLDALPFPDFSGFKLSDFYYSNALPVLFSRGCIQRCVFCTVTNFWQVYRSLSGRRMFEQVKYYLSNFKEPIDFHFYDPLINGNIKALECFCGMIISAVKSNDVKPIRWRAEAIIRPEMSYELLAKMKQAGCYQLAYGIESGSQKVLDAMKKRYRICDAEEVLKNTHEAGIQVSANFMFGFPTETRLDFQATLDFLSRNRKHIDEIYPSESFCCIDRRSYLYSHPGEFNLLPDPHIDFWETLDGSNNYPERMRRFEEFCDLAVSLNLNVGSGYRKVKLNKEECLKRYYAYKNMNNSPSYS